MDGARDSHMNEVNQKEIKIPYNITYVWNIMYISNRPFHRKEICKLGEETCGCQGEGVGWTGNLGLRDANFAFGMNKQ